VRTNSTHTTVAPLSQKYIQANAQYDCNIFKMNPNYSLQQQQQMWPRERESDDSYSRSSTGSTMNSAPPPPATAFRGASFPAPAPVYTDIINDDLWITNGGPAVSTTTTHAVTTAPVTATAVVSNHSDPSTSAAATTTNEKVVVIPPSSVLFDDERAHGGNGREVGGTRSATCNNNYAISSTIQRTESRDTSSPASSPTTPRATYVGTSTMAIPQQQQYSPRQQQQQQQQPRIVNGRVVKAKHAHLPDAVLEFRAKRQQRTVVATVTGGAVGLVTAGPLGAVVCATGAYAAAKTVGKHREHRLLEKCLQSNMSSDMYDNATTSSSQRTMVAANTASLSSLASGIPIHRAEAA
jgi:hypothetical protein